MKNRFNDRKLLKGLTEEQIKKLENTKSSEEILINGSIIVLQGVNLCLVTGWRSFLYLC